MPDALPHWKRFLVIAFLMGNGVAPRQEQMTRANDKSK